MGQKTKLVWDDLFISPPKATSEMDCPQPNGLSTDSRTCSENQWFLPLKGQSFDGHRFLTKAFTSTIKGFFYEAGHPKHALFESLGGVAVEDTLIFLGTTARAWRRKHSAKIIAITGSTGKTTVKNICEQILKTQFTTLSPRGSMNNEIGVPLTLLQITDATQWAVIEMGARKPNDIGYLVEIAEPDICGVLNATHTHVEIFGSREVLLKTKCEMFTKTPKTCVAVAPDSDPKILAAASKHQHTVSFGSSKKADVYFTNQKWSEGFQYFDLNTKNHTIAIASDYLHESLGQNTAAAVALCQVADISNDNIQTALKTLEPAHGRFQKIAFENRTMIHDAYNASPASMTAGLRSLEMCFSTSKKLVVLGDMLELGDLSKSFHEEILEDLEKLSHISFLVLVGKNMQHLMNRIPATLSTKHILSVDELSALALKELSWDVAYFKASNSMNFDRLIKAIQN